MANAASLTATLGSTAWKWLIVGHRWLGIATCLLFAMWFVSGLVMMYVDYPALTSEERLSRLQRIDWSRIATTPERVIHRLSLGEFPRDVRLTMLNGEPVYRVNVAGSPVRTLSAVDGRSIEHVSACAALAIARSATPDAKPLAIRTLQRDQWMVAGYFNAHRPLHRVALNDSRGTELYVSSTTGEIVLDSTARERAWNWAGAVLHWLYFRDLRANTAVWSQVVMWTSGVGTVVAISGLWLGIVRLRIRPRNRDRKMTPYRGWMAWHHLAGIIGGMFLLTWIFSGWLSMGPPVPWEKEFNAQRLAAGVAAYSGNIEPDFGTPLEVLNRLNDRDVREASFEWALGRLQIVLTDSTQQVTLLDGLTGKDRTLAEQDLIDAAPRLVPDAQLVATQRLDREDAYWYSRNGERKLPVLRFIFDDPNRMWVHVDPKTGKVLGWMRASDRVHRWLFNAFHSWDFRWLLQHRPAWDLVMWVLSLAGLVISTSGAVIGWRRLRR